MLHMPQVNTCLHMLTELMLFCVPPPIGLKGSFAGNKAEHQK